MKFLNDLLLLAHWQRYSVETSQLRTEGTAYGMWEFTAFFSVNLKVFNNRKKTMQGKKSIQS